MTLDHVATLEGVVDPMVRVVVIAAWPQQVTLYDVRRPPVGGLAGGRRPPLGIAMARAGIST
ncbi:MAG: hypothetical protein ACK6DP_05400 [Gemmatimonas sp.]|uniref:hypothetical protein n=1 Tax=Gemmatimonas sp. TaxID=1962908 RepID=UPI00391F58E4